MAIQKRYGLRLTDSKETRRLLSCVANLAQVLETHLAARS
jgi:acyl carrier protein